MSAPPRGQVVLALLALYLIWGSTYLGIRVALEGFPPLLMAGARYVLAGGLLYAFLRLRGAPRPSVREWGGAFAVGTLLVAGNALVSVSEQWVSSGLAAVVIASMPLWAVLLAGLWGEWPSRREWTGLGVGLAGVALLQGGGELRSSPLGAALLVASTWSWALGSMWSRRLPLPGGPMASAAEMLGGGAAWLPRRATGWPAFPRSGRSPPSSTSPSSARSSPSAPTPSSCAASVRHWRRATPT